MKFTDPKKVCELVQNMKQADLARSRNRGRIDSLFNGDPPYTDEEAEANRITTNVNFLEATTIAQNARRQLYTAHIRQGNHFKIRYVKGKAHKRQEWSGIVTRNANRPLRKSLIYRENRRAVFAQLALHGIGPVYWPNADCLFPKFIALDDIKVPSGTLISLENLDHFSIRRRFTPADLIRMTTGKAVDPGWNQPMVKKLMGVVSKAYGKTNSGWDANTDGFEKITEDCRENSGFWNSDAVPTVDCQDFFFLNTETKEPHWEHRIIVEQVNASESHADETFKKEFLYEPTGRKRATDLSQILHVQFADGANVAPFRWHSIRSLGKLLYAVCHIQNRIRCRFVDALFESMLWYFRNYPTGEGETPEIITLQHMGVIPEGASIVPTTERHTVNEKLISAGLAQNRQLMSEHSSAFTQDINDGTPREMTATESAQRAATAAAMVNQMLTMSSSYEETLHTELVRRLCNKASEDKDIVEFRKRCIEEGVPEEMLDPDNFEVETVRVLGSGNKSLEIAQTDRLMAARNLFDAEGQRIILRQFADTTTDDSAMAEVLVPEGEPVVSDAQQLAQLAMGPLMAGLPFTPKRGISEIQYVETLLQLTWQIVQRIEGNGGNATQPEIVGLITATDHISRHIAIVAEDESEKQRVKSYEDALSEIANLLRAYVQRFQEAQQQAGADMPPEVKAKVQASIILAQTKAQILQSNAAIKQQQREQQFLAEERRKNERHESDIAAKDATTQADIIRDNALGIHKSKTTQTAT